jgi:hypothetical protein
LFAGPFIALNLRHEHPAAAVLVPPRAVKHVALVRVGQQLDAVVLEEALGDWYVQQEVCPENLRKTSLLFDNEIC